MRLGVPLIAFWVCWGCATALAQSTSPQPLWEVGVFGMSVSQEAYPGAAQQLQRNLLLPYVVYRGEWLRVDRGGIELRKVLGPNVELDLGFSASLGSKSDEIEARSGMPELGTLVEVGPRIRWTLDQNTNSRLRAVLSLRTALDASDKWRDRGIVLEPQLVYEQRTTGGLQWSVNAGLLIGDERIADTFYGVAPRYQTPQRGSYVAKSGLIAFRISTYVSTALTPDVSIAGGARIDLVDGGANRESPLVRQNSSATVGVWLTWTLARSQTLVRD